MRIPALPLFLVAALLPLAACSQEPAEPRVTVEQARVSLPAIPGRPGAAYFTLRTNHENSRLTGIDSPRIGRIELHETVEENGMSRMVTIENPVIGPGEAATFEPGGRHAMLFDLDPALQPGGTVQITFTFDPAPPVTVEAELRPAGSGGHDGH